MSKINKNLILLGLEMLAILGIGLVSVPNMAAAVGYGVNYMYGTGNDYYSGAPVENPKPSIDTINPRSSNIGVGTKTVTVIGSGFIPSSIVRINGVNRASTFIDDTHILVQVTGNDISNYRTNGGFYINVYNGGPGGGYSNAAFFTINNSAPSPTTTSNTNPTTSNFTETDTNTYSNPNDTSTNYTETTTTDKDYKGLASNAIFGSGSFLPSGLLQWILLAIIIAIIVVLIRKIFGGEEAYHAAPMKHD